jgi:hypothetical protein
MVIVLFDVEHHQPVQVNDTVICVNVVKGVLAHRHENTHYFNVYLSGDSTSQHTGQHENTMICKGIGFVFANVGVKDHIL